MGLFDRFKKKAKKAAEEEEKQKQYEAEREHVGLNQAEDGGVSEAG